MEVYPSETWVESISFWKSEGTTLESNEGDGTEILVIVPIRPPWIKVMENIATNQ